MADELEQQQKAEEEEKKKEEEKKRNETETKKKAEEEEKRNVEAQKRSVAEAARREKEKVEQARIQSNEFNAEIVFNGIYMRATGSTIHRELHETFCYFQPRYKYSNLELTLAVVSLTSTYFYKYLH